MPEAHQRRRRPTASSPTADPDAKAGPEAGNFRYLETPGARMLNHCSVDEYCAREPRCFEGYR